MAAMSSSGWRALSLGVDAAAVDADADRAVVLAGDVGQEADLLRDRLLLLVVVEVAGVVADLVHVGRHRARPGGSSPAGRPRGWRGSGGGSRPAPRRPAALSTATRTRSPAGLADGLRLLDGGVDVLGARRAHALHGDRMRGADQAVPTRTERVGLRFASSCRSMGARDGASRPTDDRPPAGQPLLLFSDGYARTAIRGTAAHRRGDAALATPSHSSRMRPSGRRGAVTTRTRPGADGREHAGDRLLVRVDQRVGRARAARSGGSRRCPRAGCPSCRA